MQLRRSILQATLAMALAAWGLFAQNNAVPFVNVPLVPDSAAPGSGGFTMTVNGTGFVSSSVVNWNGSPRATTFVNSSQLTAAILAADVVSVGTASVTVVTPGPGVGASSVVYFPVIQPSTAVAFSAGPPISGFPGGSPAAGDLNGDGKVDLVLATEYTVQVLLGNGDGTFRLPQTVFATASGSFGQPTLADFNGDGKLDIAVANGASVSVLLGNGDGSFQIPNNSYGPTFYDCSVGDFNGDGKLDILSGLAGSTFSVLLGNGDGTFRTGVVHSGPVYGQPLVGDFNHDGHLDFLTYNGTPSPAVFLGNGDGTFQPPIGSLNITGTLAVADLNGDGILDVVGLGGNQISIALGIGDGTFQTPSQLTYGGNGGYLVIDDFNGDGKPDLVVSGTAIWIFFGNGDGTFQAATSVSNVATQNSAIAADVNGDGRLDLVGGEIPILQTTVALSPFSFTFPTLAVGQTSPPQALTVTNIGPEPVNFTASTLAGGVPSDFAVSSDTCAGTAVAPSGTCTVSLTFTPTEEGPRSATINVNDNAPGSPQFATLRGIGIALKATPGKLDFGSVKVHGISQQKLIEVTNTSTQKVTMKILVVGKNENDFIESDSCDRPLAGKATCTIAVQFAPTKKGTRGAAIAINAGKGQSPKNVPLTGVGM